MFPKPLKMYLPKIKTEKILHQVIAGVPRRPAGGALCLDYLPSHAKACVENFKQQSSPPQGFAVSGYYVIRIFIFYIANF
jgi:hypothetical protein